MRMLLISVCAVVAAVGAGCGFRDPSTAERRSAAVYDSALSLADRGDHDRAIAALDGLGSFRDAPQRLLEVRRRAADVTLSQARGKLAEPQAAVALTRTSLRYRPTPAARAFLAEAEAALRAFKRRKGDDDGPGPPPGKGKNKDG